MRRALILALLVAVVSVGLGTTVFRDQAARAKEVLFVQEQNLDGDGNIKVHEQGEAKPKVTGLPVATKFHSQGSGIAAGTNSVDTFETINASTIILNVNAGEVAWGIGPPGQPGIGLNMGPGVQTIPFNEPVPVHVIEAFCFGSTPCQVKYSVIGN
jgi:hypothetical protein